MPSRGSRRRAGEAGGRAGGAGRMDAGRCPPGGRLDMSHGFVRHIRRNQIARDDYDRQVKQAKEQQLRRRLTPAPPRPRRPDRQVYRAGRRGESGPPGRRARSEASSGSSSSSRERRPRGPALFCLEYEADGGQVTSVVVYQDNDPEEVVEKVSAQNQLEPALHQALRQRVQEELEKRRVKR
uniref:Chromosome 2 open reading frame 68 n=1 Tax=Laticauda laticaudata TaxID=8630 RepID=A0A8C5RS14_LATLA